MSTESKEKKQSDIKAKVYEHLNLGLGRELPKGIVPRADAIIIGLVMNLPDAKEYKENGFVSHKNIYHNYNNKYELSIMDFKDMFPFGMAYGKVLAVGSKIESDVAVGDKVLLRSNPNDTFIYDGSVFHFIREVDIAAIVKEDKE